MHNFKELKVWQLSIAFSKLVFEIIKDFPSEHKFGIANQLIRCSVSIPSNITEGCGRKSDQQCSQFVSISLGSAFEIETHIIIAKEVKLITEERFNNLSQKILEIQ